MTESKISDMNFKQCNECKEVFPATLEYFYKNVQRPDGNIILRKQCKKCFCAYKKKKNSEVEMKQKIKELNSKRYLENRAKHLVQVKENYGKRRQALEFQILEEFYLMRKEEIEKMVNVSR